MLYKFLLNNKMNQLYVYICPLPLGPSHPSRSSQRTKLSSLHSMEAYC